MSYISEAAAMRAVLAVRPEATNVDCPPLGDRQRRNGDGMAGDHQPKHAAVNGSDWRRKLAKSLHRRRPSQPRSDEVRAAAYELFHRVDELHHNYGWPYFDFEERAYKATRQAREAFEQNKSMTKDDMLKALAPVLDEWWPERLGLTDAARHAVDRLRRAVAEAKYAPDTDIHHRLTDIGQPHQRVA